MFKNVIDDLMKERGWTKYKLAKMSGLPQSTITSLFSKRVTSPSIETATKIAQAFGVSLEYLLGEEAEGSDHQKNPSPQTNEEEFHSDLELDLSDEDLLKKYDFKIDGRSISEAEIREVLAYIRVKRQM